MQSIMRMTIATFALAGLTLAACRMTPNEVKVNLPGDLKTPNDSINAVGIFGCANVNLHTSIVCAGRVPLSQGSAIVKDACFSGDTNVVVCTDTSAINPVRCSPGAGALLIGGSGNDVVAYARMR
ncbi:MAG TPA: hypothetical protein VKV03_10020 [Candidatus Binataceae bacterium]|nr:hypothetical protein [Candidatus Binataceae bacterium]